jgi:hypothetical protein
MTDFAKFLKKSTTDLDRFAVALDKMTATSTDSKQEDTRFWKPERDKSGNASAVIRFLPVSPADGDDALPWVRIFDHGFKGPSGKWYIEKSLTTLNQKDPVSEYNSQLWNSTTDDNSPARKQAREQKRRLSYYSNIMVISDPKRPENEGKVFLFKFGKKIFDKITAQMKPEFDGDPSVNVFDFQKGANFRLRMRQVAGFPNYDESRFDAPSALNDDMKTLENIWRSEYSLKELVAPKNFKTHEELKRRLEEVLELSVSPGVGGAPAKAAAPSAPAKSQEKDVAPWQGEDEEDDELKQFQALAK